VSAQETPARHPDNPKLRRIRFELGGESRDYITGEQRVTTVPLKIRRKSNRKMLIPPPGRSSALSQGGEDASMIRTLGKAFYWQKLLDDGKYPTIRDMAQALKMEQGWMAEVLRLTMLAPDIVEAILEGHQPRHLDLQTLKCRNAPMPREWHEQRVLFGFTD